MNQIALLSSRPWVGGSSIAPILCLPNAGNRSPLTEYLRLHGQAPELDAEDEEFFEGRRSLESFVAFKLKVSTGMVPIAQNVRYTHPDFGYFRAEIDAETAESNEEYKTGSEFTVKNFGSDDSDDFPAAYAAQVQWGLMIRPKPMGYVNVQLGFDRRPIRYPITPDKKLQDDMLDVVQTFMKKNVFAGVQPDPINISDCKQLWPRSTAQSILADKVMMGHLERMAEADARLKAATKDKEDCKFQVAALMGEADTAINEHGKVVVTYKTQQRKAYSVEASEARVMLNKLKA